VLKRIKLTVKVKRAYNCIADIDNGGNVGIVIVVGDFSLVGTPIGH
jgi:hypothetical protein